MEKELKSFSYYAETNIHSSSLYKHIRGKKLTEKGEKMLNIVLNAPINERREISFITGIRYGGNNNEDD